MAKPLTEKDIENLPDDDPDEAFDLMEELGINTSGIIDTAQAKQRLRDHLKQVVQPNIFKCEECELTQEDIDNISDLPAAHKLMVKHSIPPKEVKTKNQAVIELQRHMDIKHQKEQEKLLPEYSTKEVAKVVRKVVEENRKGRVKLLDQLKKVKEFIRCIPEERREDISNQLPDLDQDLQNVFEQLEKDNCTIMIAGETGAGKSCILNLLLGELTSDLMAVNNLPSTSAMCEIKYGENPYLMAYPARGENKEPERVELTQQEAPGVLAKYVSQRDERSDLKYNKVEVYWPCEWIKEGITITDTPGVGESAELTQLVKDYIPSAFGFIYVINTPNAGGINPEELEDLLFYHITKEGISGDGEDPTVPMGQMTEKIKFDPRSAIFICNKWDQVPTGEKAEVKEYVRKKLSKVWKDFDFNNQVFFISATKTIDELKMGYVSTEFRRLLLGIQNLLPVGFRTKMESQFWKMFHIMDRGTWVLKNYVLCGNEKEKKEKLDQYATARKRLSDLEKKPHKAKKEMNETLEQELKSALSKIKEHMESDEVQKRLENWMDAECPDNDNLDRLHQLQNALANKRIKQEINRFEQEQGIFEDIQKTLMTKFQSIFVSVESELINIENAMKEEPEMSSLLATYYQIDSTDERVNPNQKMTGQNPIWVPLGVVIGAFALPFVSIKNMHKVKAARKELKAYRKDKPIEMAKITIGIAKDLVESDKLRSVIEDKLVLLKRKFGYLLDRIPAMIDANKILISKLQKDLESDRDLSEYIPLYQDGVSIQDNMNFVYMCDIRTFDIEMADIKDMKKIGEGSFAFVYRGRYERKGRNKMVAVKRLREALTEQNVTDFLTEELNLMRIQAPNVVHYLGTSVKRNDNVVYPVMIQEYCAITLDKIIYNKHEYQGPGSVPDKDPKRPELAIRAARFADEISKGLTAMHRLGYVHRDLKPENVLVDKSEGKEVVKLCDLGITKREIDITKTVAGTPMYMAPEISKEQKYDRTVDIFALGLMVWEIWYGAPIEQMYTIDNYKSFVKKPFRKHEPPKDWRDIMNRCWSSDPKKRPRSDECSAVFCKLYNQKSSA